MVDFFLAAVIAVIYVIFLFLEMRFILKENKPLKLLFRDGILVYLSVLLGSFIYNEISIKGKSILKTPNVFTDTPDF